jgi:YaiO family outer membrane protein
MFALAADVRPYPWDLRVELDYENLDNGQPDWREGLVQLAWKPRKDFVLLGGLHAAERFDQRDREFIAAAYLPATGVVFHVEGTASSTHRVLPRDTLLAEVACPIGSGWVITPGAKYTRYATGDVSMAMATVEKYVGDYRFAYTGYVSRLEGAAWTPAHRIAASWYRGQLTQVTVSAARGREVENVYPLPLLVTDVRAASVAGAVEVGPRWALTFEAAYVRQGDLYTRRGIRLGTRVLF